MEKLKKMSTTEQLATYATINAALLSALWWGFRAWVARIEREIRSNGERDEARDKLIASIAQLLAAIQARVEATERLNSERREDMNDIFSRISDVEKQLAELKGGCRQCVKN